MYSLIFIAHLFSAGVEVGQIKLEHLYVDQATCKQDVNGFVLYMNHKVPSEYKTDRATYNVEKEFNLECKEVK